MAWPLHPSELFASIPATRTDWNNARQLNAAWDDAVLSVGSAITVPGDGKYRVTYAGAQNLDDILGTSPGDQVVIHADVTGAGASLTIRSTGGGGGNIRCNAGVDIVLASNAEWAWFMNIDGILSGGMMYGAP